ncbi:TerD family protein [uncultured Cardiobacterium sp.]|uniref:TerD family protein n=1 Tax=uncultured Cardiobacterium sp. TaxID=417619 RepID=UPI0026240F17|nr:TerD family protein [uncultured Cardiobacterium sp.]
MAITLQKGQGVSLRKESGYDLSRLTVGLGWDIAPSTPAYDLDAVAFLLDGDGKVRNLGKLGANGRPTLEGGDVVFYKSLVHPSGKVRLSGDNQSGSTSGDAEQIEVALDTLPDAYRQIIFAVAIYKGHERKQSFAGVRRAHIRAVDGKGQEICRYDIGSDPANHACAMTFASVVRGAGGWNFNAIGEFHDTDRFIDLLKRYLPY